MKKLVMSSMMCLYVTLGWGTMSIGEASVTLHVFEHLQAWDRVTERHGKDQA
jgi:hypothetical protein